MRKLFESLQGNVITTVKKTGLIFEIPSNMDGIAFKTFLFNNSVAIKELKNLSAEMQEDSQKHIIEALKSKGILASGIRNGKNTILVKSKKNFESAKSIVKNLVDSVTFNECEEAYKENDRYRVGLFIYLPC